MRERSSIATSRSAAVSPVADLVFVRLSSFAPSNEMRQRTRGEMTPLSLMSARRIRYVSCAFVIVCPSRYQTWSNPSIWTDGAGGGVARADAVSCAPSGPAKTSTARNVVRRKRDMNGRG